MAALIPRPVIIPRIRFLVIALGLSCSPAQATEVLFVGNSFTFGNSTYNASAITDANGTGHGGLPAAFKKLSLEGGYTNINVTIEAVSGQTLAWHHANKAAIIGRAWDYVVLQEHSQRPLTTYAGGNVAAFRSAVQSVDALVKTHNPAVRVLLYETWARPDMVPTYYSSLAAMQGELRAAYSAAAADFSLQGWVPVGEGYMQALDTGLAYNPAQGAQPGKFNLFVSDNYHPSGHGCYLGACLFYAKILGGDPRALPTGVGSAAAALGLTVTQAASLQQVAYSLVPVAAAETRIVAQPVAAVARMGGAVAFSVAASGIGLTYQWRHNGVALAGRTAASLTLSGVTAEDGGLYDVVVTGEAGSVTSAAVALTVTTRVASSSWFFDLGSAAAGYPTAGPDSAGRHWNQMTNATLGAALSTVVSSAGVTRTGVSVAVVGAFSGINQGGVNVAGAYPATAQWDSFFVTGTGTTGAARKGELRFAGLNTGGTYAFKLFSARAGSGSRTTRFTVSGTAPVFLEAMGNTANTVATAAIAPFADGTLLLAVEPYDEAGTMTEYGYLNVVEVTETTPAPSAYELWASGRGLAGAAADFDADADGDGRANLLEYALGTDPVTADAVAASVLATNLVSEVNDDRGGTRRLEITVTKPAGVSGVNYAAEVSSDLRVWTGDVEVVEDSSTMFRARDTVAISAGARRFIRLKVSN